jgi:hypothetical protein
MPVNVWDHLLYNPHGADPEDAEAALQRCVDLLAFINSWCYAMSESGCLTVESETFEGLGRLTLMLKLTLEHVYHCDMNGTCRPQCNS